MKPKKPKKVEDPLTSVVAPRMGVVDSLRATFGAEVLVDWSARPKVDAIPTGSLSLDMATGVGGYPRGRIIEVVGPESAGKTTLMLHAIAEAQKLGDTVAFLDAEHAFDPAYAQSLGVDVPALIFAQPDYGEQALDIVEALIASGDVKLIVVDSVAALTPKAELEGDMEASSVGVQARMMGKAMRKLTALASKNKVTVIFINQLRMKVGVLFGNPETTPGGGALRFFASMRLDIRRIGKVTDKNSVVIGNRTRVKIVKNKLSAPFKEVEFSILWGIGIDATEDLIDAGINTGVITKSGSWYSFGDIKLGQGTKGVAETLEQFDSPREAIVSAIQKALAGGGQRVAAEE